MIEVVAKKPDAVTLRVTVRRLAVYLDNWAIVALAKDQGQLRNRFLRALGMVPTSCSPSRMPLKSLDRLALLKVLSAISSPP